MIVFNKIKAQYCTNTADPSASLHSAVSSVRTVMKVALANPSGFVLGP